MKTSALLVTPARSIRCAFALLGSLFLVIAPVSAQTKAKPPKGDEVERLVDAAQTGVGKALDREGKAVEAQRELGRAREAEGRSSSDVFAKFNALTDAQIQLKDAIARKEAADKGAKEADAAANKQGATDADRARAKQAREVAQAAFRKVDELKGLVTQRTAELKIAQAPIRARELAQDKLAKAKTALDAEKSAAQALIDKAAKEAERLENTDRQKERLLKRLSDLRAKLAAIKDFYR